MTSHALRALLRLREEARRYSADNRAAAPLSSEAHTTRDPAAMLNEFIEAANGGDAASKPKRSKKKAA